MRVLEPKLISKNFINTHNCKSKFNFKFNFDDIINFCINNYIPIIVVIIIFILLIFRYRYFQKEKEKKELEELYLKWKLLKKKKREKKLKLKPYDNLDNNY